MTLRVYAHWLPGMSATKGVWITGRDAPGRIPETQSALRRNALKSFVENGEPGGNRTHNPQIKSLLLCQLSYRPTGRGEKMVDEISSTGNSDSSTGNPRVFAQLNVTAAIPCVLEDASATLERWPNAPVAQLDRAAGFEPVGRGFKSLRARQNLSYLSLKKDTGSIPVHGDACTR
jgi:hypothetical protein